MKEIYKEHRGLFRWMVALLVLSVAFLVFGLVTLSPSSAVVKTGYSDIGSYESGTFDTVKTAGGYRDGNWSNMFVFPIMAIILGVFHNLIAVKLYRRRGEGMARVFVVMSIVVLVGAWLILIRLLGEG